MEEGQPIAAQITTVRFRALRSKQYDHEAIEAEARVAYGQDPAVVLADLKKYVLDQLGDESAGMQLDYDVRNLEIRKLSLTNSITYMEGRLAKVKEWAVQKGLTDFLTLMDDIPF